MNNSCRELRLEELLPAETLAAIGPALTTLLGANVALLDPSGKAWWGMPPDAGAARSALIVELEAIGQVAAQAAPERVAAAMQLLLAVARARARYLMVSELHLEAVAADFEKLKLEHKALQESEARYKSLAAELEQRVRQQVETLEERQRQLYQAEKLASVGQLAAGVAHEINNPIGFIHSNLKSFGDYLERFAQLRNRLDDARRAWADLELDFVLADGRELVADSTAGADRIARIVKDLRGFSNIDRPEEEMVDVNDSLRSACAVIAGQKPDSVALTLDLKPVPPLLCLPGLLNQVFLNLLINALQAVGQQGEIRVSSQAEGTRIVITIADNGVGIAADVLPRVFEPFFTTRDVGLGTGLGLTVAHDVIQVHGGSIELESALGRGTTVRVILPT
jgi:two-component system, NtrC family, sensor kinase